MKKQYINVLIILLAGIFGYLKAANSYFTTSTSRVGPGVIHKKVIASEEPWTLNVLQIDLTNPYIRIKSVKADNRLIGREILSSIVSRNNTDDSQVVGAVNGDFFNSSGVPINSQVIQGEMLKAEDIDPNNPTYWSTIGFDSSNKVCIATNYFAGKIFTQNDSTIIDDINTERGTDQMLLYNSFYGNSTGTGANGKEVLISPLSQWFVNDKIRCLVEQIGNGNLSLSENKAVLSGSKQDSVFLTDHLNVGDTLSVYLKLSGQLPQLHELMGGFPRIVKNAQNYALAGYHEEGGSSSFATDHHPRTAVGFSADSTILYFVTVDGRQSISRGMDLMELAEFMICQGVAEGMNLDGGGSTEIIVRGEIENSPSDGSERAVANALVAISTAPQGELNYVQIEPDNYRLFKDETVQLLVSGWDQYYNPSPITPSQISFITTASLGTVTADGLFTANAIADSGYVVTEYNGLQDSAFIYLKSIRQFRITPRNCIADTTNIIHFSMVLMDEDNCQHSLSPQEYSWQSLNPSVGQIDSLGYFKGISAGETQVVASFDGYSDTADIRVVCFTEGSYLLNGMDNIAQWYLSGKNIDLENSELNVVSSPCTEGEEALQLNYTFRRLSSARSWAYLKTDIHLTGIPDSVSMDIFSDGNEHVAYLDIRDNLNQQDDIVFPKILDDSSKYETAVFLRYNEEYNYPLTIEGIKIRLGASAPVDSLNQGTLYFDNLKVFYSDQLKIKSDKSPKDAMDFRLYQNYPNPFNRNTRISFVLHKKTPVTLRVYNLIGEEIVVLLNNEVKLPGFYKIDFDEKDLPSGLYFYEIQIEGTQFARKMLFLK